MKCEVCGNDYDRALNVSVDGESHVFDCFECAVEKLAPRCGNCNTRIIGHGLQAHSEMYCCAHCAKHKGVTGFVDRV
ncbi:MAG: hypothetical protein ACODAC_08930 [Pseudomonadota bacterium]